MLFRSSAGSATEKYAIYQESAEAKINKLKTTITELYTKTLDSKTIKTVLDFFQSILEISSQIGGLVPTLALLGGSILAIKNTIALIKAMKLAKSLAQTTAATTATATATDVLTVAQNKAALSSAKLQLALGAIMLVIGAVVAIIGSMKEAQEAALQAHLDNIESMKDEESSLKSLKQEYIELSNAINPNEKQADRLKTIRDRKSVV